MLELELVTELELATTDAAPSEPEPLADGDETIVTDGLPTPIVGELGVCADEDIELLIPFDVGEKAESGPAVETDGVGLGEGGVAGLLEAVLVLEMSVAVDDVPEGDPEAVFVIVGGVLEETKVAGLPGGVLELRLLAIVCGVLEGEDASVPDVEVADELGRELELEADRELDITLVGEEAADAVLDGEEMPLVALLAGDEALIDDVVDEQDATVVSEHGMELAIGVTDMPQGAEETSTAAQYSIPLN